MEFLYPNFLFIIPLFLVLIIFKKFFFKKSTSIQVSNFNSLRNFFGYQGKFKVFLINSLFFIALVSMIIGLARPRISSVDKDITVEVPNFEKSQIPWRYNFFNPLTIDIKDSEISLFVGRKNFQISTNTLLDNFKNGDIPAHVLDTLPPEVRNRIKNGERKIDLDPERLCIHYYKKDDWSHWANPLIYAILDDVIMLEKMRLADLSALDGAISNIRLWTLGNLDHKILPNKNNHLIFYRCQIGINKRPKQLDYIN